MSLSSSDSWRGRRAADIIDLDRYMRGGVRSQHPSRLPDSDCEQLVVDCGGTRAGGGPAAVGRKVSTSTTSVPRDKRYSQDSGLSDGSYVRRRTHRRVMGDIRSHRERERKREARAASSTNSMRTFRAACKQALRDQQEQIARVAELCERLTRTGGNSNPGGRGRGTEGGSRGGCGGGPKVTRRPPESATQDSSEESSSSSRSTSDRNRKDKHRRNKCKTYKLIMRKLEELERWFAVRGRSPPTRPPRLPRVGISVSGGSVSVSDKVVATDNPHRQTRQTTRRVTCAMTTGCQMSGAGSARTHSVGSRATNKPTTVLVERAVGGGGGTARGVAAGGVRLGAARGTEPVTNPLDVKPTPRRSGCLNVATESVFDCGSSDGLASSVHSPNCQFDLDDPLHLYKQAKRLQTLRAATVRHRAHSVDSARAVTSSPRDSPHCQSHKHGGSLCGRCRGYWHTITTLAMQIFGRCEPTM